MLNVTDIQIHCLNHFGHQGFGPEGHDLVGEIDPVDHVAVLPEVGGRRGVGLRLDDDGRVTAVGERRLGILVVGISYGDADT